MYKKKSRIYAIINPISGIGSKDRVVNMLSKRCIDNGCPLNTVYTEYAGHATELTAKALDDGVDLVIAIGGDGTVNEVAQKLLYTNTTLGIIPRGSGNGLARELHIPMTVGKAIETIFSGNVTTIDACKANERVFFCTCGVGFDATVSAEFAKGKRRGSLTYVKTAIENYLKYKPETYEIEIGSHTIKEKAFLITCANASQYGNNAYIAPHADIRDGMIDITILSPFIPLDVGPLALQLFTKTIDFNSKIKTFRSKTAHIIRRTEGVMHLDGEPVMAPKEIDVSVLNHALKVIMPVDTSSFVDNIQRKVNGVFQFFLPKSK